MKLILSSFMKGFTSGNFTINVLLDEACLSFAMCTRHQYMTRENQNQIYDIYCDICQVSFCICFFRDKCKMNSVNYSKLSLNEASEKH